MQQMDLFRAAMVAEGVEEVDTEEEYLAAWQLLVDTGVCWRLQGWFGRTAAGLIQEGLILLPRPGKKDENDNNP